MTIRYIISHGVARCVDFSTYGTDVLTLRFEPRYNGTLMLDGMLLSLRDGEAKIPFSALASKHYAPILECDGGRFTVTGFTKSGKSIAVDAMDEATVRDLIEVCYALGVRLERAEQKIKRLDKACQGHDIFNFERKE